MAIPIMNPLSWFMMGQEKLAQVTTVLVTPSAMNNEQFNIYHNGIDGSVTELITMAGVVWLVKNA